MFFGGCDNFVIIKGRYTGLKVGVGGQLTPQHTSKTLYQLDFQLIY